MRASRSVRGTARRRRSTSFISGSVRTCNERAYGRGTVVKLCCSIHDCRNDSNRTETTVTRNPEDEDPYVAEEQDEEEAVSDMDEWTPDFHWLTGDLAVGACFPIDRADELARDHGIGAVIDLRWEDRDDEERLDRKSTRLNSSHVSISYAVF